MAQDPYKGFRFRVEIQGIQQAGFMECSSLGSHIEVVEYREGGDIASVHMLPGKISYPDITLKCGMVKNPELYEWALQAVKGVSPARAARSCSSTTPEPKNCASTSMPGPAKWDGPAYNAKGNDVSIETLTLTCDRIEKA
jgi:phage tail-like protein